MDTKSNKEGTMLKITQERITYELKEGTKNAWRETERKTADYTEEQHRNFVEAAPFFRRLGGSETLTRSYTPAGYKVVQVISKSPDRTVKKVTNFKFEYQGV